MSAVQHLACESEMVVLYLLLCCSRPNMSSFPGVLSNWVMDSRYFSKRVPLGSDRFISFIFLDTSPCVAAYRADDQSLSYIQDMPVNPLSKTLHSCFEPRSHWDPCGSDFPTCEPIVQGPCKFHENILRPCLHEPTAGLICSPTFLFALLPKVRSQNCTTQFEWFKAELAKAPPLCHKISRAQGVST